MGRITELLGCRYPVVQGAMGVISNPELVAAVSDAGGFGLLATIVAPDAEFVRDQVRQVRALTDRPFGANLFAMSPLTPDIARVLAEEGVTTVTFSGGSPKPFVALFRELGLDFLCVVSTVRAAVGAAAAGAAAVVAEGAESGGVVGYGTPSTLVLVPQVVDAVDVPVLAAGGIADARGYRAALALGAVGVQVGTRFIATRECLAHEAYKQTLLAANDLGTGLVDLGRYQVRVLRTPLVERLLQSSESAGEFFTPNALRASWLSGDLDAGLLPAGQAAAAVADLPTAGEVVRRLVGA